MLYKIKKNGTQFEKISVMPFLEFSDLGKLEKDLENIISKHLFDVLFEEESLMPIIQERPLQAEADIYALNKNGDLIIFELKRGLAGDDAMLQALRYSQESGQWKYGQLDKKYQNYIEKKGLPLQDLSLAHKEAFDLEKPLQEHQFNEKQHLVIIGSAANDKLIDSIEYWNKTGLLVNFIPYRIYEIGNETYFEFFAHPYDRHHNPLSIKGVLFDTNRTYDENALWEMIDNNKISAYGGVKNVVEYLNPRDIVFFTHKGFGIVAAGEVTGTVKTLGEDEQYRNLNFLTSQPNKKDGIKKFITFSEASKITGKSFFWAKTIKVPYLSRGETKNLLDAFNFL